MLLKPHAWLFCALLSIVPTVAGAAVPIVTEEFTVPSGDAGIDLYVRNKHAEGVTRFPGERILLYVHGATYPAETAFDLALNGFSWMDYIAGHGYDVYLVDLRGYGRSTRPPEMSAPPAENAPIVRTDKAVADVSAAVEFIRHRRAVERINLLGWSWGTTIMGAYTSAHNDRVAKLVLYAPQWFRSTPSLTDRGGPLGAYRTVTREEAKKRWLNGVPAEHVATLIPQGWFEAWADATFATDPVGARQDPPVLRAPNGVLLDGREFWGAGRAPYDPADIKVPTLLVHAEWDRDLPSEMMHAYFAKLANAPYKRAIEIGQGTHTVIMEKNRLQLFRSVQQFLDEHFEPGD